MLDDCVLGQRVVLRYRRPDAAIGPRLTDVIGILTARDEAVATVRAPGGPVTVALADLVAARPVRPARRDIFALERVAALGWQAAHVEASAGWLLRADAGWSRRANSCLPLATVRRGLPQVLSAVEAFYRDHGLPVLVQVPLGAQSLLDAELGRLGWAAEAMSVVLTRELPIAVAGPVQLTETPTAAWTARYSESAMAVLTRHNRVRFASIERDGQVVAMARGVLDEGWLGISAVQVDPAARRQGLATALIAGLAQWAVPDASHCYLQVEAANLGALALYRSLGFSEHHRYHYRRAPGSIAK